MSLPPVILLIFPNFGLGPTALASATRPGSRSNGEQGWNRWLADLWRTGLVTRVSVALESRLEVQVALKTRGHLLEVRLECPVVLRARGRLLKVRGARGPMVLGVWCAAWRRDSQRHAS